MMLYHEGVVDLKVCRVSVFPRPLTRIVRQSVDRRNEKIQKEYL
jgi:hypothetical protein